MPNPFVAPMSDTAGLVDVPCAGITQIRFNGSRLSSSQPTSELPITLKL